MEIETLAAAVVTGTVLHQAMEPNNIIDKLDRLKETIKTGKVRPAKIQGIDSTAKTVAIGTFMIVALSAVAYFILAFIGVEGNALFQYIIIVAVMGEYFATLQIDRYHKIIEKITQSHKK